VYSHVNYIPRNKFARRAAKATLGYNETRKGKDGEEIVRKLFGKTGPLTKEQAEWLIDTASKNTYFFRWILSPDILEENAGKDLDLWKLARDGVRWLEERLQRPGEIQLIGAEHNDHTEIPHIHAILLIERRGREKILSGKDLDAFREAIHQMALDQRLTREQAIHQEAAIAQETSAALQRVQEGASMQPPARHHPLGPVITLEPTYGSYGGICLICKGEKGKELIAEGIKHCPGCGRILGWRKEAQLRLSR
jgi:hypothetical protein